MLEIPCTVLDERPAPTSSGQLARTPLPHLLVYTHDRQLTGTFEFRAPDGSTASALLIDGRPAKARLSATQIYLGQVLLELGAVDAATLDEEVVVRVSLVEDLDRDTSSELRVLGEVHVGHTARAEPAHDPVAPVEDGVDQRILSLCHRL